MSDLITNVDETVHALENCVFFGRLSDITLLPDWFSEDEAKDTKRYADRWAFIMNDFPSLGLGLKSSQHTKIFLATDNKEVLYAQGKGIKIVVARLAAGLGRLVLCDGYPLGILDSFAMNIAKSIQLKQESGIPGNREDWYAVSRFYTQGVIPQILSKALVTIAQVEEYNYIENWKVGVREYCKKDKTLFVDMTRPDWTKTYFPELDLLLDRQEGFQMNRVGMYNPGGGPGGSEPFFDGGVLN